MNILVYGYGVMGKKVVRFVEEEPALHLVGVVSPVFDEMPQAKTYQSLKEVNEKVDAIIDFSHPDNLDDIIDYTNQYACRLVLATTGYSSDQLDKIKELSKKVPVFQSYNTSFGVAMLNKMVREYTEELYKHGFDVEIIEAHHHRKVDAPSGTAVMLYESASESIDDTYPVYDRESRHQARDKNEIGISSIRAGSIYGEHTVLFGGEDELIELKHTALSRDIFAKGAVSALLALENKDKGLYNLKTLY